MTTMTTNNDDNDNERRYQRHRLLTIGAATVMTTIFRERLLIYTQTMQTIRSSFLGSCNVDGDGTSKRRRKLGVENSTIVLGQSLQAKQCKTLALNIEKL